MDTSTTPSYDRAMIEVGMDMDINSGVHSKQQLSAKRIKKGECPSCGIKLFKVVGLMFGKKRVPLNTQGQVREGRCLACRPVAAPVDHSNEFWARKGGSGIPREVQEKSTQDDSTCISGVTLEHHFSLGEESSQGSLTLAELKRVGRRPGASFGEDCADDQPRLPRRSPTTTLQHQEQQVLEPQHAVNDTVPVPVLQKSIRVLHDHSSKPNRPPLPTPIHRPLDPSEPFHLSDDEEETKTEISAPEVPPYPPWTDSEDEDKQVLASSANLCDLVGLEKGQGSSDPKDIFFDSSEMCDLVGLEENGLDNFPKPPNKSQYKDIHVDPESLQSDEEDTKPPAQRRRRRRPNTPQSVHVVKNARESLPLADTRGRAPGQRQTTKKTRVQEPRPQSQPVITQPDTEIPSLVRRLERDPSVLSDLTGILWSNPSGKETFVKLNGVETLTKLIWADMSDSSVQEPAMHLLLALVASHDADPANDLLLGEPANGVIDALLVVMQVLLENETIQECGCRILGCLAMASATHLRVNDGTLSGAVQIVASALKTHSSSQVIQECGMQTLFYQISYSMSADSNKRALIKSGAPASILAALKNEIFESAVAEWAVLLYWSLSQDIASLLPSALEVLEELVLLVRGLYKDQDYIELLTAAVGTIVNLVKAEENHKSIDATDLVVLAVQLIQSQKDDVRIVAECCGLIANLTSISSDMMDPVTEMGGLAAIVQSVLDYPENEILFENALRSVACLSVCSIAAREVLADDTMLSHLIKWCRLHDTSATTEEMLCTVLSSVFAVTRSFDVALIGKAIGAICYILQAHPESTKVQEAGCFALRSLSNHNGASDFLVRTNALELVLAAMARFEHKRVLQLNGCCVLWNFSSAGGRKDNALDRLEVIDCIVKVMQNHLEAAEVLEMACGCLTSVVHGSMPRKTKLAQVSGVDAVACCFVMNADNPVLLANAGGLLSTLSTNPFLTEKIIHAQGLSLVVDAMRCNGSSLDVLLAGSAFLRNVIVISPEHAAETISAAPSVLSGMTRSADPTFMSTACSFLWAISALSAEGRRKILALDGVAILMNTMEEYSDVPLVLDAALGAINQLALTSG